MHSKIKETAPKELWGNFLDLNSVPRASKKEEQVVEFVLEFAKKNGLEAKVDHVMNVLITKPATKGMEDRKKVVLQSHLDMVHQKNEDTDFDFATQGIEMFIEDNWIFAKGTTLGADNGIGVASIMTILESKTIEHPAIEALFTIDEETGMTGALGVLPEFMTGDILLNLDTEADDEITIGCAGGIDISSKYKYKSKKAKKKSKSLEIKINGLRGGHSGVEIHKGYGNANKILGRILYMLAKQKLVQLNSVNGGGLRNAIPREAKATVFVSDKKEASFEEKFNAIKESLLDEFSVVEPNMNIELNSIDTDKTVLDQKDFMNITRAVHGNFNGVYKMSTSIEGLVETSNNLSKWIVKDGKAIIENLTRSSSEFSKKDISNTIEINLKVNGFKVKLDNGYPGWQPNKDSSILKVAGKLYEDMFGDKPEISACHAGLECGILGTHYPEMEMISFGPTIRGAHSPKERVSIESVQKYWGYLLELLKNIPKK